MRRTTRFILLFSIVSAYAAMAADTPLSGHYQITLTRKSLSAGESVEIGLIPPLAPGLRISWFGTNQSAIYRAPYVIPPDTPPVIVGAGISGHGVRTGVSAQILLIPSRFPGADDCLGPGQSWSTTSGTFQPDVGLVDELPEAIVKVPALYPHSALLRGQRETILVQALVCRTGRVLDAYAPQRIGLPPNRDRPQPDPALVTAALAAARQWVFKPALVAGQPIATWVAIPVVVAP